MTSPLSGALRSGQPLLRPMAHVLGGLVVATLAYYTVHFYRQYPLHYILDQTEESYGPYWARRWWLLLHIAGGTLALFMGPSQFWPGLRRRFPVVHRTMGRMYVGGVFVSGAAAFYMSSFTQPLDFAVALFTLTCAWWMTVAMAFAAIRRGLVGVHREWMIRGYVLTFAFVAFRYLIEDPMWEPLGSARHATVTWLAWVPPLLVTEILLQWRRTVASANLPVAS